MLRIWGRVLFFFFFYVFVVALGLFVAVTFVRDAGDKLLRRRGSSGVYFLESGVLVGPIVMDCAESAVGVGMGGVGGKEVA